MFCTNIGGLQMNKKLIKMTMSVGLSAAMLLCCANGLVSQPQVVNAASSYKIKLNHNSVVYNVNGKKKVLL